MSDDARSSTPSATDDRSPFAVGNIRAFIAFRLLFNSRFYYPVFMVLFLDFGLTVSQFAILNAVWAASIVLLEVPSGALADVIGRKRLVVVAATLMIIEMLLLCLVPLGNTTLIFWVFALNRLLSGAAEAAASGADESLAYDSLKERGQEGSWPLVLEWLMRLQSASFVVAMVLGAALYDADFMNRVAGWLGIEAELTKETTLRIPLWLTFALGVGALVAGLRMREPTTTTRGGWKVLRQTLRQTAQTARWVIHTPLVAAVILFTLFFDSIARQFVTIVSEYYRIIGLPEASFGLLGSLFAVAGLIVPRFARWLLERWPPVAVAHLTAAVLFAGFLGIAHVLNYAGILFVLLISAGFSLVGFFVSAYLNRATASARRATVLSFRGLAFNLGYGAISLLYMALVAGLKESGVGAGLESEKAQSQEVFVAALAWFPWYLLVGYGLILFWASRFCRGGKRKGPEAPAAEPGEAEPGDGPAAPPGEPPANR